MIYYTHINEDNRIERTLLQSAACQTVLAVCGSGERVISLMDNEACKRMIVVDINKEAIFLLQLKLMALRFLSVEEYLQFIGHFNQKGKERLHLFEQFKKTLPTDALHYWERNKALIAKGVLHGGHFERFLHRVRPMAKWYLGKRFADVLTTGYVAQTFPHRRWNLLKKIFSYKVVYKAAGNKDIAFVGSNAEMYRIPAALDNVIKENKASSSFMAHLVFNGHLLQMPDKDLPPSLQRSVLDKIKHRLAHSELMVDYYVTDLLRFVKEQSSALQHPVFYSISDILSFADFTYLEEMVQAITGQGSLLTGRSFLRNRLTTEQVAQLNQREELELYDGDESSGMYQVFSLKIPSAK